MADNFDLSARLNGPPRLVGKAKIVVCSYRGGGLKTPWRSSLPGFRGIINAITLFSLREFVATYRDHYANPRSFDYQIALVRSVLDRAAFSEVDVLIDSQLGIAPDAVLLERVGRIIVESARSLSIKYFYGANCVILVYPDALGLSWTRLETRAMLGSETVVVVNGRRRLFTLDAVVRRSLIWRRFLANTRIFQIALGVGAIPLSAVIAMTDRLRGRT